MAKKKRVEEPQLRMPRSIHRFYLEGDFKGFWFDADTYIPIGMWLGDQAAQHEELDSIIAKLEEWKVDIQERGIDTLPETDRANVMDMFFRQAKLQLNMDMQPYKLVKALVLKWNFVDHDGKAIKLGEEGFDLLPKMLVIDMWRMILEYVTELPKGGSETLLEPLSETAG